MLGLGLVRSLENDWRATLDTVARQRGWPTSADVSELARRVAALSAAYNDPSIASANVGGAGAARLGFSFARDVPKGAAAVRELVSTGNLRLAGGIPLRILDIGAGLGATTWGVVRALEAAGASGVVEATWVDPDAQALDVAVAVLRERTAAVSKSNELPTAHHRVDLRATTRVRDVTSKSGVRDLGRFDVVVAGQLLSELDVGTPDERRVERHAAFLMDLLEDRIVHDGSLVVIEPALRDRTRHLHRVRDAIAVLGATLFAPCMHARGCPALAHESDWCHEDVPVDLPGWLVPVSRAAGLRHQGLTFSYLVLRKDRMRLAGCVGGPPDASRLRIVSDPIPSKGKHEVFVCGEFRHGPPGASSADRVRATRLDRDTRGCNADWAELKRGDIVVVSPPLALDRPRITTGTHARRQTDAEVSAARGAAPDDDQDAV